MRSRALPCLAALCLAACDAPSASGTPPERAGAALGKSPALLAAEGDPVVHGPRAEGRAPIYDEQADSEVALVRALEQARREGKRVLITFGGNWCGWCHALHDLFEAQGPVRERLMSSYVQVLVDSRTGKAFARRLGAELQSVPFLTVVDLDANALAHQQTGALELARAQYPRGEGLYHDAAKVRAFLDRYAPAP